MKLYVPRPTLVLLDVESLGLHGEDYAVAWMVIRHGQEVDGQVRWWDGREWVPTGRSLCIHPEHAHSIGDELVALYLGLRFSEVEMLATAGVHQQPA